MSILDSINRSIRNVFVGSHKGEDINLEAFEEKPLPKNIKTVYTPQPPPGFVAEEKVNTPGTNDLGVDPNEWFGNNVYPPVPKPEWDNPLDSMPLATNNSDWFTDNPDESDEIEKEKSIHQTMYEMATARYNPFSLGGSENCDSDIDCNIGGSENVTRS